MQYGRQDKSVATEKTSPYNEKKTVIIMRIFDEKGIYGAE